MREWIRIERQPAWNEFRDLSALVILTEDGGNIDTRFSDGRHEREDAGGGIGPGFTNRRADTHNDAAGIASTEYFFIYHRYSLGLELWVSEAISGPATDTGSWRPSARTLVCFGGGRGRHPEEEPDEYCCGEAEAGVDADGREYGVQDLLRGVATAVLE